MTEKIVTSGVVRGTSEDSVFLCAEGGYAIGISLETRKVLSKNHIAQNQS
jgi:hypothetical protein